MQILVALIALPMVALLLALATRLEDGLRAVATEAMPPAVPGGSIDDADVIGSRSPV